MTGEDVYLVIRVEGRVQGVGYRVNARREAARLGVVATPENLADGTVRITVRGSRLAVERFVVWCHRGPRSAEVRAVTVWEESGQRSI